MASTSVAFEILARDRASSTFQKVGSSVDAAGSKVSRFGSLAAKAAKAGAVALGAAAVGAGYALVGMAKSAIDDEAAQKRLATALRNNAGATRGQIADTEDWITHLGKAFGVADDDLRPALGRLVAVTKDVGQAQRFTRLAMDVSAGSGKSLKQVTEALAKAQLGSMTGLSKLGVATKDAEGKTRSLNAITKDLAKTYEGQASKAAHTTAGKFERLKLWFDETKESIGAKLIPVADKLATLALTKLDPALDEAWGYAKELAPAFVDVGRGVASFLLPTLKVTADTAKGLATFFAALPDPVQKFGLAAAAVAIVLPKVTAAVSPLTAGLKINTAAIAQWRTEMASAETRMTALRTGMRAVGTFGKSAAIGVLAMVPALSSAAQQGNSTASVISGVLGGAMSGLAFGPIGALIGGVAGGGLTALVGALHDSRHAAGSAADIYDRLNASSKTLASNVASVASTLDQATGAMGRNTAEALRRTMFVDNDPAKGLKDYAQRLVDAGVSTRTLTQALQGNKVAVAQVRAVMVSANDQALEVSRTLDTLAKTGAGRDPITGLTVGELKAKRADLLEFQKEALDSLRVLGRSQSTVRQTAKDLESVTKALGLTKEQFGKLSPAVRDNLKVMGDSFKGSESQVRQLAAAAGGLSRTDAHILVKVKGVDQTIGELTRLGKTARDRAVDTGEQISYGVSVGILRASQRAELAAQQMMQRAIGAMRAEAYIASPSKKTRQIGQFLAEGLRLGIGDDRHRLDTTIGGVIADAIDKKKVADALARVADLMQTWRSKLSSLLSQRNDFASNLADSFKQSVFGQEDVTDIGGILAFQRAQLAKAQQLQTAMKRLLAAGVSKDVLEQLSSAGESGLAQIQALAGASLADIKAFNALNSETSSALKGAGMDAANSIYAMQIDAARDNVKATREMVDALKDLVRKIGDDRGEWTVHIDGNGLVKIIRKAEREAGHPLVGASS